MKVPFTAALYKLIEWFTYSFETIRCLHFYHNRKFSFDGCQRFFIVPYILFQLHITNGLQQNATPQSSFGGVLSSLEQNMAGGGTLTNAIEGGLVGTLASKFGLPPMITGAIAGALPGIIQKYIQQRHGQ